MIEPFASALMALFQVDRLAGNDVHAKKEIFITVAISESKPDLDSIRARMLEHLTECANLCMCVRRFVQVPVARIAIH